MSDYLAAAPSRPKPRKRIWPYAMGLAIVLVWSILTLPAFIHGITPYATESGIASGRVYFYFATHGFILAIVVWLLISAPFIRWQGPHPGFFFILLLAAVAPNIIMLNKAKARAGLYHYDHSLTQSGLTEAKSAALSTISFGPQHDTQTDIQARKLGAVGQIRDAWRQLLDGVAADIGGYQSRSESLEPPTVDPAKLARALAATDARANLAKARRLADSYQTRSDNRFTTFEARLAKIDAATNGQSKALVDKGDGLKTRVDALWAKRRAILAEEDAMAASKAGMSAYDGHQKTLPDLVNEAQALQRDMQQYASTVTGELSAALGETDPDQ